VFPQATYCVPTVCKHAISLRKQGAVGQGTTWTSTYVVACLAAANWGSAQLHSTGLSRSTHACLANLGGPAVLVCLYCLHAGFISCDQGNLPMSRLCCRLLHVAQVTLAGTKPFWLVDGRRRSLCKYWWCCCSMVSGCRCLQGLPFGMCSGMGLDGVLVLRGVLLAALQD
jgi:hypothetical protein